MDINKKIIWGEEMIKYIEDNNLDRDLMDKITNIQNQKYLDHNKMDIEIAKDIHDLIKALPK